MKKTLIASAIALTALSSSQANASMAVTVLNFDVQQNVAEGAITDSGAWGAFNSVEPFLGIPWTATQESNVITNNNGETFAGESPTQGFYDHAADIALMRDEQVAVGVYFNWNGNNNIPLLAVFDCVTTPGICVGQTTGQSGVFFGGMQTPPMAGQLITFDGTGSLEYVVIDPVPVPAAIWLFGSGLLGLVGVARSRKRE